MKALIQLVAKASVQTPKRQKSIGKGLLVFLGITHSDTIKDIDYLVKKIVNLRIFPDKKGQMNLSLAETGGEIMVISQFTLYAATKKGNRPSFTSAARPETAEPLYRLFIKSLRDKGCKVSQGKFAAFMQVSLVNSGPVTVLIDSKIG